MQNVKKITHAEFLKGKMLLQKHVKYKTQQIATEYRNRNNLKVHLLSHNIY